MLACSVIKDFNIFKAGRLHLFMVGVTPSVIPFVLEAVKPTLGWCVVPAVSFATHRASHTKLPELVLKDMAGVLAAAI